MCRLCMHTQALAERGETCRLMSAAARASGDRVLTIVVVKYTSKPAVVSCRVLCVTVGDATLSECFLV